MNAEEARKIITQLNAILKSAQLDWVVQEVSDVIERGVEERKEVAFESFDVSDQPIKKHRSKSEAVTTRPFTDIEELRLLIAAVRSAVVDTNQMQEKALLGLKSGESDGPQVAFRPDIPEGFADKGYSTANAQRGNAFDFSLGGVEGQRARIANLAAILTQLEEIIRAD